MESSPAQTDRSLPMLATELRITVTAVLGYLDLMATENGEAPFAPEEKLEWTGTVERRLMALRRLSDELLNACAESRGAAPLKAISNPDENGSAR